MNELKLKPYRCGDGRRFATLAQACDHAGKVFAQSGIIVAIEYRPAPG